MKYKVSDKVKIMKSRLAKKITIIMSYDYDDNLVVSDDNIAYRIRQDLSRNIEPKHERIESINVEDYEIQSRRQSKD